MKKAIAPRIGMPGMMNAQMALGVAGSFLLLKLTNAVIANPIQAITRRALMI